MVGLSVVDKAIIFKVLVGEVDMWRRVGETTFGTISKSFCEKKALEVQRVIDNLSEILEDK